MCILQSRSLSKYSESSGDSNQVNDTHFIDHVQNLSGADEGDRAFFLQLIRYSRWFLERVDLNQAL
jgi:hypothetical protein